MRKTIRKIWKIENLREKNVQIMEKKLSDKNDPKYAWDSSDTHILQKAEAKNIQ